MVAIFQWLVLYSPSQSLSRGARLVWAMCVQQKTIPWKAQRGLMLRLAPVLDFGRESQPSLTKPLKFCQLGMLRECNSVFTQGRV